MNFMKKDIFVLVLVIIAFVAYALLFGNFNKLGISSTENIMKKVSVIPISHATAVFEWEGNTIYVDPTGGKKSFANSKSPDIILVTDIHGDHLNKETLEAVMGEETVLIAPKEVVDLLPETLAKKATILLNGETINQKGFSILAIPMYNLPESADSFHTKGRGNGYVVERDGIRIYVAGDTADIPEMRALKNIDIALIPMNLPYTMSVENAASGVLAFAPKIVYPYHYRGPEGLNDVGKFKRLVNAENPDIRVILGNWYPETKQLD